MAFLDLVKQRYSCRSYQEKSVEQKKLDYVMECVRFAPSAVNKQPWMFRMVKNEVDKAKLQECYNRRVVRDGSDVHYLQHPGRRGVGTLRRQTSW